MTRALWTHLVKDLRIELRSLDALVSMLFFSLLVVVLFSIAFDPHGDFSREIAGGVLSVATMFASVSALNQAWARENPTPSTSTRPPSSLTRSASRPAHEASSSSSIPLTTSAPPRH